MTFPRSSCTARQSVALCSSVGCCLCRPCCNICRRTSLLCLQALSLALPQLQLLKLAHVAGLCDEGVSSLRNLTGLLELAVLGPHNKALSQTSLRALAPLRGLRSAVCSSRV
jgi:hypothetical protein